jgi:hypothetical protein
LKYINHAERQACCGNSVLKDLSAAAACYRPLPLDWRQVEHQWQ